MGGPFPNMKGLVHELKGPLMGQMLFFTKRPQSARYTLEGPFFAKDGPPLMRDGPYNQGLRGP